MSGSVGLKWATVPSATLKMENKESFLRRSTGKWQKTVLKVKPFRPSPSSLIFSVTFAHITLKLKVNETVAAPRTQLWDEDGWRTQETNNSNKDARTTSKDIRDELRGQSTDRQSEMAALSYCLNQSGLWLTIEEITMKGNYFKHATVHMDKIHGFWENVL